MSNPHLSRRGRLGEQIGKSGIAIVGASPEVTRSNDVTFDFHQSPNFLYLTGFYEPDAIAVLVPGNPDGEFVLFVRPRDPEAEAWNGIRAGVEGARTAHGADQAYPIAELKERLGSLVKGRDEIWSDPSDDRVQTLVNQLVGGAGADWRRFGHPTPSSVRDVSRLIGEMRLIKDESEIDVLREVCKLSAEGHLEAMRYARPGRFEYEVQAAMEYSWRQAGARHNGYPSIVASGPNNCILHYIENDRQMAEGDLMLVDAAAELDGYAADITRTFPISGEFTGPQRALYEVVLHAIKAGFAAAVTGSTMAAIDDAAIEVLTGGLVDLGLLPLSVSESLAMNHYRSFYFHGTGHWLGLDVHDEGASRMQGKWRPLKPGMVFTIEPGLYVGPEKGEIELSLLEYSRDEWAQRRWEEGNAVASAAEKGELDAAEKITHLVPAEFLGLGIRIEDDILITDTGMENLSASVPIEMDEIEAVCAEQPRFVRV